MIEADWNKNNETTSQTKDIYSNISIEINFDNVHITLHVS